MSLNYVQWFSTSPAKPRQTTRATAVRLWAADDDVRGIAGVTFLFPLFSTNELVDPIQSLQVRLRKEK